jgi:hypothetical protein
MTNGDVRGEVAEVTAVETLWPLPVLRSMDATAVTAVQEVTAVASGRGD